VATGCGSSADTHSKDGYIQAANKICGDYNARIKLLVPSGDIRSQAATAHRVNVLGLEEITKLRALSPPPSDASRLNAIYAETEQALRTADTSTDAIARGDVQAANVATQHGSALLARANQDMAAYGLTTCAQ
jgi:hypothetical protein